MKREGDQFLDSGLFHGDGWRFLRQAVVDTKKEDGMQLINLVDVI